MNRDRLIKKGLLEEKREKLNALNIRADRLVKDINFYLFSIVTDGIDGIQIDHAHQAMEDLVKTVDEFKALKREIKRLAEEF